MGSRTCKRSSAHRTCSTGRLRRLQASWRRETADHHADEAVRRLYRDDGELAHLRASPSTLPLDPDGVKAPVPSAGPYYVFSEFVPGQQVVLERNRFYTGDRPHHVDRIVVDLALDPATVIDKIERGGLDYGWVPPDRTPLEHRSS